MKSPNWGRLAFDTNGKECNGKISNGETSIEIYKNWLYISNPNMWNHTIGFLKPIISLIDCGEVTFGHFRILAERYELQQAVFTYVTYYENIDNELQYTQMAGIGCYGLESQQETFMRLYPTTYLFLDKKYFTNKYYITTFIENNQKYLTFTKTNSGESSKKLPLTKGLDPKFIGPRRETVNAFQKWLKKVANKEYYNKINFDKISYVETE